VRTVWSGESYDTAKKAEEDLYKTMKYIGLKEVTKEDQENEHRFKEPVFRISDEEEDTEEATDFFIYDPRYDKWIRVDLTTATNPEVINKKMTRYNNLESKLGQEVKLLRIPGDVLDRASRHCERDVLEVRNTLLREVFDIEI